MECSSFHFKCGFMFWRWPRLKNQIKSNLHFKCLCRRFLYFWLGAWFSCTFVLALVVPLGTKFFFHLGREKFEIETTFCLKN